MRKVIKKKHARAFSWMLIACLAMTTAAPGLTVFAADDNAAVVMTGHQGRDFDAADSTDTAGETDKPGPLAGEDKGEVSAVSDETSEKAEGSEETGETGDASQKEDYTVRTDDIKSDEDKEKEDPKVNAGTDEADAGEKADPEEDGNAATDDNTSETGDVKNDGAGKVEEEEDHPDLTDGPLDADTVEMATVSDMTKVVCEYNGEYYENLQDAVNAVKDDASTITLIRDVRLEEILEISKKREITLDLDTHTLYGRIDIKGGAFVTVEDGTIDSGKDYCVIYASGDDDWPTRFTLADNAKIQAENYGLLICGVKSSSDNDGTGFVVMIDGEIEVTDPESAGIWLQGKMKKTSAAVCDVIINGTVSSGFVDGPSVAINGWGNVTVNEGAEISGATGIEIRAGSLTVNGGTVMGSTAKFEDNSNTNGSTSRAAGIMINEHTTDLPITVKISGGIISGYYALAQDNTENRTDRIKMYVTGGDFIGYNNDCAIMIKEYDDGNGVFSIFGGIFTDDHGNRSDISMYLGEDYGQDEEGRVISLNPIFQIGDGYYSSFEDVISAVQGQEDPTVTITGDIEESDPISIQTGQKLNMDLSGNTLTINENADFGLGNSGNLTLTGKGTIIADGPAVFNENSSASLTIDKDITIVSRNGAAVANNSGRLDISGTVVSESGPAVLSEGGIIEVSDGALTGKRAIEVKGGTLEITGGTLTGSGDCALYVADPERMRSTVNVTVKGGTFVTDGESCIVNDTREGKAISVYCGRFSKDTGLDKLYATDRTVSIKTDDNYEVYTYKEAVVTPVSCTEEGNTRFVCDICGDEYIFDVKEAPGHDWGEWSVTTEPTLSEDGEMKRGCSRCGEMESAIIDRTGYKLTIEFVDSEGYIAKNVRFEIYDGDGKKVGDTYTQNAEIYLPEGKYTVVIVDSYVYDFDFTSMDITVKKDDIITFTGTDSGGSGDVGKPDEDEDTPAVPGEDDNTPTAPGEDTPAAPDEGSGSTGSHYGRGGSSGGGSRPTGVTSAYVSADGKSADWTLNGLRFTKADGTHPSNEYLIIDGVIYAFYTNGYVVSFDNAGYYSEGVLPALEDIPVATGSWELCGWWLKYSDGSIPKNAWAQLTHNGRSDWYHFDVDGWMDTGWKLIDGYWYYFGADGAMLYDTQTPDGHMVDADGRRIR